MQYIVEEAGSLVYIKELASYFDVSLHQNVQNSTVNTTVYSIMYSTVCVQHIVQ